MISKELKVIEDAAAISNCDGTIEIYQILVSVKLLLLFGIKYFNSLTFILTHLVLT